MNPGKKTSKERIAGILFLILFGSACASLVVSTVLQKSLPELLRVPPLKAGMKAPEFDLVTLQQERISLAQFRGKPVILMFWGSG